MNLIKFNPKKIKDLFDAGVNYNIMLTDGSVLTNVFVEYVDDKYVFSDGQNVPFNLFEVIQYSIHYTYQLEQVGNGWVLSRNGIKTFPENKFGVIDNKLYADSLVLCLNSYENTYTPDTIKKSDLVVYTDTFNNTLRPAIVIDVIKPRDIEDHGCVEVFFLDNNQYFEHFTYIGWNEFLTVTEEY